MQRIPVLALRCAFLCAAAIVSTPAPAQAVTFKHFKLYPKGQWQQELIGYRDGKALGPPVTTTTCTGPLDPKAAPGMAEALKAARAAAPTCTAKVVNDQEMLAESETVCQLPGGVQTLHLQLRAIDDRTIASETRSTLAGQPGTVMKSKVTYLGPCPAGAAAAQSRPSAADCAGLAQMRQDNEAAGGAGQCAQLPAQYRGQCEAGLKMMAALEQQCK